PAGAFVDTPATATILGAAKVTGRTRRGWTVGALEAVTGREFARFSDGSSRGRVEAEPLTNYFVARAQRELGRRAGIGFLAHAVNRSLRTPELEGLLGDHAWLGGVDGHVFIDSAPDWGAPGGVAGSPGPR